MLDVCPMVGGVSARVSSYGAVERDSWNADAEAGSHM